MNPRALIAAFLLVLLMCYAIAASSDIFTIVSYFFDIPSFLFIFWGAAFFLVPNYSFQHALNNMKIALSRREDYAKVQLDDAVSFFGSAKQVIYALGILGFLIGLVLMLRNLTDPDTIGYGMAVALLCTLYAVFIAEFIVEGFIIQCQQKLKSIPGEGQGDSSKHASMNLGTMSLGVALTLLTLFVLFFSVSDIEISKESERVYSGKVYDFGKASYTIYTENNAEKRDLQVHLVAEFDSNLSPDAFAAAYEKVDFAMAWTLDEFRQQIYSINPAELRKVEVQNQLATNMLAKLNARLFENEPYISKIYFTEWN